MKACILKPIMWNTNNYIGPSGHKSSSGFSRDYGYGHEEWNNNPEWNWRNFKIFHTEDQEKFREYSETGDLCILMTVSHDKGQYAVGIATNVSMNDDKEMKLIAEELHIYDNYKEIWKQPIVRNCFNGDLNKFIVHWKKNYTWIRWKCPIENYLWFSKPVLLDPMKISGKQKIISMHGSYQAVLPQTILEITYDQIKNSPAIIEWLTTGEFDIDWVKGKQSVQSNAKLRKKYLTRGGNAPAANSFSYWVEGKRNVEPLHAKLQAMFVKHLSELGIKYKENVNYIDVQYNQNKQLYYCEIKPTENIATKYAIRIAVGQLMEYIFFNDSHAIPEIVLSTRPGKSEIDFVKSLDFRLTWFDKRSDKFITV